MHLIFFASGIVASAEAEAQAAALEKQIHIKSDKHAEQRAAALAKAREAKRLKEAERQARVNEIQAKQRAELEQRQAAQVSQRL